MDHWIHQLEQYIGLFLYCLERKQCKGLTSSFPIQKQADVCWAMDTPYQCLKRSARMFLHHYSQRDSVLVRILAMYLRKFIFPLQMYFLLSVQCSTILLLPCKNQISTGQIDCVFGHFMQGFKICMYHVKVKYLKVRL